MADGWLFRLSSTLGAHRSLPTWPATPERETMAADAAARGPVLRRGPAPATEPLASEEEPPVTSR